MSTATTNGDYLKKCSPQVYCDSNSKYRSVNGSCNNLETPTWGTAKTPFFRMINANYNDGKACEKCEVFNNFILFRSIINLLTTIKYYVKGHYQLRLQTNGSALPNARLVNIKLFLMREVYRPDENNVLLYPFGQLLAHDVSGQPTDAPKTNNGKLIVMHLRSESRGVVDYNFSYCLPTYIRFIVVLT